MDKTTISDSQTEMDQQSDTTVAVEQSADESDTQALPGIVSITARCLRPHDDTSAPKKKKVKLNKKPQRNPKKSKITPDSRILEFNEEPFSNTGGKLYCEACAHVVSFEMRSSIVDHIRSKKHQDSRERYDGTHQPTIDETKSRKEMRLSLNQKLCKAFVEAGIELEKFDHPSIQALFKEILPNGGDVYGAQRMRSLLTDIAKNERAKLKEKIASFKSYSLMVDESADAEQRAILNIILIPGHDDESESKDTLTTYIIDTKEINSTQHPNIIKAVQDTCEDYNLMPSKIYGFISDNASYMKSAFAVLKFSWTNAVHITCFSHIFDLVAQTFETSFPDVSSFLSSMKQMFKLSRIKIKLYKEICGCAPPKPVNTRWSSWLKATMVHAKNLDRKSVV